MHKVVAIVGRPNVGKSTLFNRLIGKRKAIVDDISGVTRDRQYDFSDWNGKEFILIDTGGYVSNSEDIFEREIKKQVEFAINEADIIIFMVDTTVGITDQDELFANYLRKVNKKTIVVANKTDNNQRLNDMYEFYKFGFNNVFPVSSINGSGTGELLDFVVEGLGILDNSENDEDENRLPRICVVGKPNVGKSTLINTLLGEERNIVSDIPGTTRDSIQIKYNKFGNEFILIDTAGLRKKNKIVEDIEFYSSLRAITAIEESDVCLLLIDAQDGLQSQDMNIINIAVKRNKGIVILINKWDLIVKESNTEKRYIENIKASIPYLTDLPVITISALNQLRIFKAVETALTVFSNKSKKISTSKLNEIMLKVIENYQPPSVKGKIIRIKYVTQIKASYPLFAFYCNHPKYVKDSYKKYLENKLREYFAFSGVPIKLSFRQK